MKMSFGICCFCWPFCKSDNKSTSTEDVPLLVVSDPQKDAFNQVYPLTLTEDEDEDFKNVSLKLSITTPKKNDPSGDTTGLENAKLTLHDQTSESDEWEIPSQKKIPLWQQLERIKSPTDDRPPLWK